MELTAIMQYFNVSSVAKDIIFQTTLRWCCLKDENTVVWFPHYILRETSRIYKKLQQPINNIRKIITTQYSKNVSNEFSKTITQNITA